MELWNLGVRRYEDLLPKLEPVENREGRINLRQRISTHIFDMGSPAEYLQRAWLDLYRTMIEYMSRMVIGNENYLVVKFHPTVETRDYDQDTVSFHLGAEIMVAQTANVVMPTFVYNDAPIGHRKVIEWRCGYCQSPNKIEERHCSQCGSPRALLLQEMYHD